jgi:hypothetical protein
MVTESTVELTTLICRPASFSGSAASRSDENISILQPEMSSRRRMDVHETVLEPSALVSIISPSVNEFPADGR